MGHLKKFLHLVMLCGMLQMLIYFKNQLSARHRKLKATAMHNKTYFEIECKAFTYDKSEWTMIIRDDTYSDIPFIYDETEWTLVIKDHTYSDNCHNFKELLNGKLYFNG